MRVLLYLGGGQERGGAHERERGVSYEAEDDVLPPKAARRFLWVERPELGVRVCAGRRRRHTPHGRRLD